MSFEERNAVTGILACFVTWGIMLSVLVRNYAAGVYDGDAGLVLWAQAVLWLILIGIGLSILGIIGFNIAYGVMTGEKKLSMLADERDNLIGLRGIQATLFVLSIGIITAIIALACGVQVFVVLNIILVSCALSSLAGCVTQLVFYRRGF